MKKAVALGGLLLSTALHADEPRWTASVPLWKVLAPNGTVVAVHPGPVWMDSRGPVVPAARLGQIEAIPAPAPLPAPRLEITLPELPNLPQPPALTQPAPARTVTETTLPQPRVVPHPLPLELREMPVDPPPPMPPKPPVGVPSQGPELAPPVGPSLGPLPGLLRPAGGPELVVPPMPDADEPTEFATERVVRVQPLPQPEPIIPANSYMVAVALRLSPLHYPPQPTILPSAANDKYTSPYHPVRHLEPLTSAAAAKLALPHDE